VIDVKLGHRENIRLHARAARKIWSRTSRGDGVYEEEYQQDDGEPCYLDESTRVYLHLRQTYIIVRPRAALRLSARHTLDPTKTKNLMRVEIEHPLHPLIIGPPPSIAPSSCNVQHSLISGSCCDRPSGSSSDP
jgi:hypothetical protein